MGRHHPGPQRGHGVLRALLEALVSGDHNTLNGIDDRGSKSHLLPRRVPRSKTARTKALQKQLYAELPEQTHFTG